MMKSNKKPRREPGQFRQLTEGTDNMLAQPSSIYNQGVNAVQDGDQITEFIAPDAGTIEIHEPSKNVASTIEYVTAEMTAKWRSNWNLIGMYSDHHSTTMRKYYDGTIAFTDSIFIGRARTEWTADSYLQTFAYRIYCALHDVCFDYDNHMHHVHNLHDDYIADCMKPEQVAA